MNRLLLIAISFGAIAFAQTPIPLSCGSPATATVGKSEVPFNFGAKKDDVVLVRVIANQGNQFVSARVNNVAGSLKDQGSSSPIFTYTAVGEDIYTIKVTMQGTGNFQVTYVVVKGSCSAVASPPCGSTRKGTLVPGQMQSIQFTGNAGDTILSLFQAQPGGDPNSSLGYIALDANQQQLGIPNNGTFTLKLDGTFTIVLFESSGLLRLNYAINLTNLNGSCSATSMDCGSTVDGSINDVLSADLYKVPASKGDVFQFKMVATDTTGGLQATFQAFDPKGNTLSSPDCVFDGSRTLCTMPADGAYTLVVRDNGGRGTGKYTLSAWRLNKPCNATSLPCGTPVAGQVDGPLRIRNYTIDAQAGDVFMLRLLRTGTNPGFAPRIDVYGPGSAAQIVNVRTTDLSSATFTAPASGTYNLVAYDDSDGKQSGTYTVWRARLNGPCDGAIGLSCNFLAPGNINQALQTGIYSYPTSAGDAFTVRLVDTGGSLQTAMQVFDPRGVAVLPPSGNTKAVDVTNSPGGAYTILVADQSRSVQQGTFAVQAFNTRGSCGTNPPQGQSVSGLISGPSPFNSFVLPASSGDALLVRSAAYTAGFSANVDLYDPSGRRVGSGTSSVSPPQLTSTGSYTAIVSASAPRGAGSYAFSWQLLNNPVAPPLQCGQTVSGSLGSAGQFWYYTVAANDNDLLKLLLTRLPGTLNAQVELFDSRGVRQIGSTGDIVRKVTAGGNYLVLVSPASAAAESGGFALSLQRPNNPCSAASLACGQTILQQAPQPGQLDAFTFSGNSGDRIAVTVTPRQGNYSPLTELYDQAAANNLAVPGSPGGTTLNATLSATSTYTLTIHDRTGNTGSYRVALQRTNNACPVNDTDKPVITLRRPTGGDVIAGGAVYQILWQSDDNIAVTSHSIRLSTDGGKTFTPISGATSLSGVAQSYPWVVPSEIAASRQAMIQVTATDGAGNAQSATSDLLTLIGSGFTPNAQVSYQYDPLNRLVQATYADGRVVNYTYDAAGNLATVTVK